MKTRRKRRRVLTRFEARRRVGIWTLIYDKEPTGAAPIRDRWYVATLDRNGVKAEVSHVFGPYYKATAEAVFEAVIQIAENTEGKARRIAKIRRGIDRLAPPHHPADPPDVPEYETPTEQTRRELEAAGFPDGPDYEALILAEDEERFGD